MEAMETMRIDENERTEIIKLVCAILHLGNIQFSEGNNDQSWIEQEDGRFFKRMTFKIKDQEWHNPLNHIEFHTL